MKLSIERCKATLKRLTISTKTLIGTIITGTSLLQIQEFRDFAIKHAVAHPRIGAVVAGVAGVLTALHNPQVQRLLHIEEEAKVPLEGGGTATLKTDTTLQIPSDKLS